jgi:acetoin:2,6-dichlorophenolindophenol oxidoreductase subunit alpha
VKEPKEFSMEEITSDKKKELFGLLLKSRRLEERLIEMSTHGEIAGWLHTMLGQEAVGVGVVANLKPSDLINNTHRGRAMIVAKGVPLGRFMAEVLGKVDGPCGGIAGEMHFADKEFGIVGNSGLLGATIPVTVGLALASKLKQGGQVVVSMLGDGTVDEGNFHESANMASVWKLPIVFVVENNRWAQFTPQKETAAQPEIWRKGEGYNMPARVADGSDVLAVYQTAREAIDRARRGEGPTLLEYTLNRWQGHFVGDAQKYRDPKDIEEAQKSDPVQKFQEKLLEEKIVTPEQVADLEKSIRREIEEAIQFGQNSPPAKVEQAFQHVYSK